MKKFILLGIASLLPAVASAQELGNIEGLVEAVGNIVGAALPIVVGIALLVFFWGLVKYIFAQGSEDKQGDAKKIMLWGIIALFVMISVWGLVGFIGEALGVDAETNPETVPTVPGL